MTSTKKHVKKAKKEGAAPLTFLEFFLIFSSVCLLIILLKYPTLARNSVIESLRQCSHLLIPSLFPMMIAFEIANECGAISYLTRPVAKPISKLLKISPNAASPLFTGIFGGYSVSVNSALSLFLEGRISKNDCEKIISYSSMPSLAFLTGFVGVGIFKNSTIGWELWLVCLASIPIVALFDRVTDRLFQKTQIQNPSEKSMVSAVPKHRKSLSKIIANAISHAAQSMLLICASTVFFSVARDILSLFFSSIDLPFSLKHLLLGSMEITGGVSSCQHLVNFESKALSSAFFIGWSGICVHLQIISMCDGTNLSFKRYFRCKAIQGLVCSALSLLMI